MNSTAGNFIPHVIDGQETEPVPGSPRSTRGPYAEVALGGEQDADLAVQAARRAFDEGPWPRIPPGSTSSAASTTSSSTGS